MALVAACRVATPPVKTKTLVRANKTRWSSFYNCLLSIKDAERAIKLMLIRDQAAKKKNKAFKPHQVKKVRYTIMYKPSRRLFVSPSFFLTCSYIPALYRFNLRKLNGNLWMKS